MGNHAFLSPSFAHIGYKCPASAIRSFQVKNRMELLRQIAVEYYGVKKPVEIMRLETVLEEDNTLAQEGTALHEIFEDAMNDHKMSKAKVTKAIKKHPDITPGTHNDPYIHDEFFRLIETHRKFTKDVDWFVVEKRIVIRGLDQHGTVDLIAGDLKKKTLYVRDLKTGYGEVSAEENYQLMTYAVGLLDEVDTDGVSGWDKYENVELHIIGVRWESNEWHTTVEDLAKFKKEVMLPALIKAYSINPPAVFGGHCRYCAGKIHCAEWQMNFEGAIKTNEVFENEDLNELDTQELVDMWKLCKQAEALMKQQLGPEIMQRFDTFDEPKGVKLVSGRRNVEFTIPEEEVVKRLKKKVKSTEQLYKKDLLTPSQLQKLLKLDDDELADITKTTQYKPYLKL